MKHPDFVHLHMHTQYSLLDGAIRLDDLFARATQYHMPALAITDHGNMFGAVEFYQKARLHDIKPIIGCEMYLAPGSRFDKDKETSPGIKESNYHIILLATNQAGYQNLIKLVTAGYIEGFYRRPRIDRDILQQSSQGLIALSACLHGEIPSAILAGDMQRAIRLAEDYRSIFSDNSFFLELQDNHLDEQRIVNEGLLEISRRLSIPLIATSDCHYLDQSNAKAHEVLLCIQTGKTMNAADRMRFRTDQFYFKSPQEMHAAFAHVPEALKNTMVVAERCNLTLLFKEYRFPTFVSPTGEDNQTYFERLSRSGLDERLGLLKRLHPHAFEAKEKIYRTRLEDEINMIKRMNFVTYFLIVADFINFAKTSSIPVGPGRGSAAGSLVAYALKITEIDPIAHGLLFERFLNPERVNPPDIDVDFCMDGRDRVIEYVTNKYGRENVSQIITFGKMMAKAVIRDVGRALDMPFKEVDAIAKLIPNDLGITVDRAIAQEPRLKELMEKSPQVTELIDISRSLEGLTRHASTHAAGVVIADAPLHNYIPLYRGSKGEVLTQYAMNDVDSIGLIKFDFLGLRTLTVIDKALKLIRANPDNKLPGCINELPLDDPKTYELLSAAETEGVFQLESSGMKDLLKQIRPENIEEITALLALFRPGPLGSGMVDSFIKAKHGQTTATYELPQLESILKETHGVILYQEQVMQTASSLANFSLADADLLRRAMGKKKPSEMAKQKEAFLEGARKNRIKPHKAEKIFDLMAKFAEYGFNKSHSTAYAYVAYQTAYLKAHYPVEFMAALLSSEMDNTDKVVKHINECREKTIDILAPDVNESFSDFTVAGNSIRFGLAAVKNVGQSAIESIIEARQRSGNFSSLFDFCSKVDLRRVNRKVLESLIKCGAFDSLGARRSQLIAVLDEAIEQAQRRLRDRSKNQLSMFAVLQPSEDDGTASAASYPDVQDWSQKELLAFEKECLGFYITGHPLDHYVETLRAFATTTAAGALAATGEQEVFIGGIVSAMKQITTKKRDPMAFVTLEDLSGFIEVIVFADVYRQSDLLLKGERPLLIKGRLTIENENNNRIIASAVVPLERAHELSVPDIHVRCPIHKLNTAEIERFKLLIQNNPGKSKVYLHVVIPHKSETVIGLGPSYQVGASELFIREIESLLGRQCVTLNNNLNRFS